MLPFLDSQLSLCQDILSVRIISFTSEKKNTILNMRINTCAILRVTHIRPIGSIWPILVAYPSGFPPLFFILHHQLFQLFHLLLIIMPQKFIYLLYPKNICILRKNMCAKYIWKHLRFVILWRCRHDAEIVNTPFKVWGANFK